MSLQIQVEGLDDGFVSLSLFDAVSGRFYGGTWRSKSLQADVYFSTQFDDPACVLVVELVSGGYAVGWTALALFGEKAGTKIDLSHDHDSMIETYFYDGTPRTLVAASARLKLKRGTTPCVLTEGHATIPAVKLKYCMRRHDAMTKISHLIADDEFVAAEDVVPGLGPDHRLRSRLLKFQLVPTISLHLEDVRVKIPERIKFEQKMLRYFKASKIRARRIAVAVHNGRSLVMRGLPDSMDGWKRISLPRADGDVLAAAAPSAPKKTVDDDDKNVVVELSGYLKHPLVAIVVALEYEIDDFRVTAGIQAYVPYDGRRLRLRTGQDPRYVELNMEAAHDGISSTFIVYPPKDDATIGSTHLVGFELRATKNGEECEDETPERHSDDSSSSDDDNNLLPTQQDSLVEPSDSSVVSSEPQQTLLKRRRRVRRRRPEISDDDDTESLASSLSHTEVPGKSRIFEKRVAREERYWRSAAPPRSSLLAKTLGAPLHRFDDPSAGLSQQQRRVVSAPVEMAHQPNELTRGDQARLSRFGVHVEMAAGTGKAHQYDMKLEKTDPLQRHEVTIQFAAVRGMPNVRSVFFTYQFYTLPPTRTEILSVVRGGRSKEDADTSAAMPLARSTGSRQEPGLAVKYVVDTTTSKPREAELFANYLAKKTLSVDVWDAESRMALGRLSVPLDRLLRQRAPVAKCAAEYALVSVQAAVDDDGSAAPDGVPPAFVQMVMCNYGEKGDRPTDVVRDDEKDQDEEDDDFENWRRRQANIDNTTRSIIFEGAPLPDEMGRSYGRRPSTAPSDKRKRPKHRVRAKPLTDSKELNALLSSRDKSHRKSRDDATTYSSSSSVSYDEVMRIVRRFRDDRGRVVYAGPLLALLEAPNLKALEEHLVRVVLKAEEKGTSLDRVFGYMDADRGGTVSAIELEDALRALGCFKGASSSAVGALLSKFDTNGDGVVSLGEFVRFVNSRRKQQKTQLLECATSRTALEARVKAMLLKAEELGASVVDAFCEFDADGSGGLSETEFVDALKKLAMVVTDGARSRKMNAGASTSDEDARQLFRHLDTNSSGLVELDELMAFVGRDYTDHLALKLRTLLKAVEEKGTRVADVFAAWDSDDSGSLSRREVLAGLCALVKPNLSSADVSKLLDRVDADKSGDIDVKELYRFVELDYTEFVEARLRKILLVAAHEFGVPVDAAFREWDKDCGGTISIDELKGGLASMKLGKLDDDEVKLIVQHLDSDRSGTVSLKEFLDFAGCDYSAVLAERLRGVLLKAEAKGTSLDAAFAQWDKDDSGTISHKELEQGLSAMGGTTFRDLLSDLSSTFPDEIRLCDLYSFMGRDPASVLETKLRRVIHSSGISPAEAFKHFDKNGDGDISLTELAAGLRELPGFEELTDDEARRLASWYDTNNNGSISLGEFERQVGTEERAQNEVAFTAALRQAINDPTRVKGGLAGFERNFLTKYPTLEKACAELVGDDGSVVLPGIVVDRATLVDYCKRRGIGTPSEIASWRSEKPPAPHPTDLARRASGSAALLKFANLLTTLEEEGQSVKSVFDALDADKSGTLTASELYHGLRTLDADLALSRKDAAQIIVAIDADRSGSVDICELSSFVLRHTQQQQNRPIDKIASTLRAVLRKAKQIGATTSEMFSFFDKNKNGFVTLRELFARLKDFDGLFNRVTYADLKALIATQFDRDGDGRIDVNEFVRFLNEHTPTKKAESVEVTKEKLRAILLRTEELGTSLRSAFRALDENRDGSIAMDELSRGLARLGVFDSVDRSSVGALLKTFDKDGDGVVDIDEFLEFAHGGEKKRDEEEEDLAMVGRDYEFSLDPDTRTVEKKMRRAARQLAADGGDVRTLFTQYDRENEGAIVRSDFVQVMMQLGLSLVEGTFTSPEETSALRRRQMIQLARTRRRGTAPLSRIRRSRDDDDSYGKRLCDEWDELALVKWYREGFKRDMVRSLLASSMVANVDLYPTFGQTAWFEHSLHNPSNKAERVAIVVEHAAVQRSTNLRLVVSGEEWMHLRRNQPPAHGQVGSDAVEADMIDASGPTPNVMLMANETVRLPFALLSLEPPSHDLRYSSKRDDDQPTTVTTVKFLSAAGFSLGILRVNTYPRPCVVDRTLRFYQAEGEILKRTIRVVAPSRHISAAATNSDLLETAIAMPTIQHSRCIFDGDDVGDGDGQMYVHCVPVGERAPEVSLQWRRADATSYEVLIRCAHVEPFPHVADFYVLLFRDRFCAALSEMWHCVVHSRLRADANGLAGQGVGCSLVVRGDRTPRVVKAFAGDCFAGPRTTTAYFDPPNAFRLVPNAHNKFAVSFRPTAPGTSRLHLHLVDCDTHELVAAWILTVVTASPQISKTYDVHIEPNAVSTKRIPYRNPWNKPRHFTLVSSDDRLVRPRDADAIVNVAPHGVDYLRLVFGPVHRPGLVQAFLYVNDAKTDQSEEVFLLRLLVGSTPQTATTTL